MMSKEVVKVEAVTVDTFNEVLGSVEQSKAQQIKKVFQPMTDMLEGFEKKYAEVMAMEISPETCKAAKRLRLDIGKVRIESEKLRKTEKSYFVAAGKAIDGVNNILKFAVIERENSLKEVELYYENLEKKAKEDRLKKREAKLLELDENINLPGFLLDMEDDEFNSYLEGQKSTIEKRLKQEEEERLERERIQKQGQLRESRLKESVELIPFIEDVKNIDFGLISDSEYKAITDLAKVKKEDSEASEKEKQKKQAELFETKKSMLTDLGFKYNSNNGEFHYIDVSTTKDQVYSFTLETFKGYLETLKGQIIDSEKAMEFAQKLITDGYEKRRSNYVKSDISISIDSLKGYTKKQFKDLVKNNNDLIASREEKARKDQEEKEKKEAAKKLASASDKDKLTKFSDDVIYYITSYVLDLENQDSNDVKNHGINIMLQAAKDVKAMAGKL